MLDLEFNTGEPLGYFITWTAYGTWLPGDERGWQRKRDSERSAGNPLFREMAAAKMKEPPFVLGCEERKLVDATVHRHCEIRKWHLHTVNARSNHIHVVVTAPGVKPEIVRKQLKAWSTKKLKEILPDRKNFCAEGGSRRYLNSRDELDTAIQYVEQGQD